MTDTCTYQVDRDGTLIGYLYGDIEPDVRVAFEAHLADCGACRSELDDLRDVRGQLAAWAPPEPNLGSIRTAVATTSEPRLVAVGPRTTNPESESRTRNQNPQPQTPNPKPIWRQLPAWAQVAAALLFLGVAAGLANLDVHYDTSGLTVRTGWLKAPAPTSNAAGPVAAPAATRAELTALEQQLRAELRAVQTSAHTAGSADPQPVRANSDADLLRRVRALVEESEKRQETELALRIGELLRDVNTQRQADLVRIDRSLGLVQNNLGVEVLKQRQQVNYLMRVNQRP